MPTSKQKKIKPVNGIVLDDGVVLSYDNPNDFREAWTGILMRISVMKGENATNPAYKGVTL